MLCAVSTKHYTQSHTQSHAYFVSVPQMETSVVCEQHIDQGPVKARAHTHTQQQSVTAAFAQREVGGVSAH